jgi:hypothetical protein
MRRRLPVAAHCRGYIAAGVFEAIHVEMETIRDSPQVVAVMRAAGTPLETPGPPTPQARQQQLPGISMALAKQPLVTDAISDAIRCIHRGPG